MHWFIGHFAGERKSAGSQQIQRGVWCKSFAGENKKTLIWMAYA